MKKIVVLALHLGTGGIENAITNFSNMLVERYDVEIISTYKLNEKPAFELNPKIKVTYLLEDIKPNKKELKEAVKSKNIFRIIKEFIYAVRVLHLRKSKMKEKIKSLDADVIISTRDFHNALLGKYAKKGIVKVAQEHNHHNNDEKYISKIIKSVKNIDYFMLPSIELTDFYSKRLEGKKVKCVYIKHVIDKNLEEVSKLNGNKIISVGRLSSEKGFLDLIDVFKLVKEKINNATLSIAGDGMERVKIQQKINELNLSDSVKLLGMLDKFSLEKEYISSDLYVMTSFTESFGLVLVEAESFGLPLVIMDSARGALQIVEDNVNGIIVKDRNKELMAEAIIKLLNNKEESKRLASCGIEKSKEYRKENVSKEWYSFIEEITNK